MNTVSRLVHLFAPHHYTLSLTLDRAERTFSGMVTIDGQSAVDATDIRLHTKDLSVSKALVDGKEASYRFTPNEELVIEHPNIAEGNHVVIVEFAGTITDDMNGIYPSYFEVDGEKKELLATQFESHDARRAFPCVDEPEAKATFDVTLTTEKGIVVLGNMPVVSQQEQSDQLVTTFATTPRMSSYLLAWVAGELHKKTATTKSGVEVNIWATPAQSADTLDFPLDIATRTIDFFDDYFGVPYPLPKSDHVALPDFSSGAMENWGLITYREIALLVDPKVTSLSTKQHAATVIAHELSHQWFGNLVTMKWWNDLWLNESFANMMEYVAIDAIEPDWNVWLDFASSEVVSALRRDSLDGVQAIQTDVNHPDEIQTIFDPSIVYAKGGRLLRMLQSYLGTEAMRAGLKNYFKKHAYQNTEADDLWQALGETSGKDVASFMHAWMTQPGFPVVSVTQKENGIELHQQQFFVGPHEDRGRTWPIPLHATIADAPEMFTSVTTTFPTTPNAPLYLNDGSTAHFITHYDTRMSEAIRANIATLSTINRLQFLHEQTLLAQAGTLSMAELLPAIEAYKHETEESVWSIIALAINELKRFVETNDVAEAQLRAFIATLVTPLYETLGWEPLAGEPENNTKLRSLIISLALYGEIPEAVTTAANLYASTSIEDLDSELRASILGNAVRNKLDESIIDSLLEAYQKSTHSELRDDIAAALTSTKESAVIERLAGLLKDTSLIRPQDFTHWFVWLLRNRYGRTFMWQWVRSEWPWLKDSFGGDSVYDMFPRYIAGALVTAEQQQEYSDFFEPLKDEIALKRNITIGETELAGRIELIERESPKVHAALNALR